VFHRGGRSASEAVTAGRERPGAERLTLEYECGFSNEPSLTVGLEEELILVEPRSLLPVNGVEWALTRVRGDRRFQAELRAAQVELVTQAYATVTETCRALADARARLVDELRGRVRLVAVGTHPSSTRGIVITDRERYRQIANDYPWAARRGLPSGLHVHVGVGDPSEALAIYNSARSYLPELAALATNSPFFEGTDTGLASARLKLTEDLPRSGIPPAFDSWSELARFVDWGRRGGLFPDLSYLWWDLRPRPDYGTLEFRIADAQTRLADTAGVAAFCQALVSLLRARYRCGEPLPAHATEVLSENRWRALRDGVNGMLVDPDTGMAEPTRDRLRRLLAELEPHAAGLGGSAELAHAGSLLVGNGADRQRAIVDEHGTEGLLESLVSETERLPAHWPRTARAAPEPRPARISVAALFGS
jgi:carboxylate-amine ligase